MFKRVEKRRRRQQEEEALGLDDELKQVLGIQETDSEESDSASESDDGGESSDEGRGSYLAFGAENEEGNSGDEEDSRSQGSNDFPISLTVQQALKEPIISASHNPVLSFCVVCPGKTLRGEKMVQVHLTSNASNQLSQHSQQSHKRRFSQFVRHSKDVDPGAEALALVLEKMHAEKTAFTSAPPEGGKSKRALKKEAFLKEKREKAKAKRRAKYQVAKQTTNLEQALKSNPKSMDTLDTKLSPPTKKRRRLSETTSKRPAESTTTPKKDNVVKPSSRVPSKSDKPALSTPSIQSIARSATRRARAALTQSHKTKS